MNQTIRPEMLTSETGLDFCPGHFQLGHGCNIGNIICPKNDLLDIRDLMIANNSWLILQMPFTCNQQAIRIILSKYVCTYAADLRSNIKMQTLYRPKCTQS